MNRKLDQLSHDLGRPFDQIWASGRFPASQLGDFFGRHKDRQTRILAEMGKGLSYSKASALSKECFDTKRWSKIAMRTASCRGLVLNSLWNIAKRGADLHLNSKDLTELASDIRDAVRTQMQSIASISDRRPDSRSARSSKCKGSLPTPHAANAILGNLRTARSKLQKNARDLPNMVAKLGLQPSVSDVAKTAVESARTLTSVELLLRLMDAESSDEPAKRLKVDPWGIGKEYVDVLGTLWNDKSSNVKIATHQKPDADAIVSTWLTERFLFPGKSCQIEFVGRNFDPSTCHGFDAVLDVGKHYDPASFIFDHKPPSFKHRDEHCASSLVLDQITGTVPLNNAIRDLVHLVHDGDAATRRGRSVEYRRSSESGIHAVIKSARSYAKTDMMLYRGIEIFLNAIHV